MIAAAASDTESAATAGSPDPGTPQEWLETKIFILPNAVILSHAEYTKIEAVHGTDYAPPLTPEMRDRLMFVEELLPAGGLSW